MCPEGDRLSAILEDLERKAGLREQSDSVRLGPLMPHLEALPDDYWDEVADNARDRLRDLYFAVEEVPLRGALIQANRALSAHRQAVLRAHATGLQQEMAARAAIHRQPWIAAALMAVASVGLGYALAGLPGEIGGALVGFFAGQHTIAAAHASAKKGLTLAEELVRESDLDGLRTNERPEDFSAAEEATGERDREFERQSAYANRFRC